MYVPPAPEDGIRRFRVEEYYRMARAGVFADDERVELLEGRIHRMTPQGARHMRAISRLNRHIVPLLGEELILRVQGPLTLSEDSEPEPDLAVVRTADEASDERHPSTALLVIEVSEDSLPKDRSVKAQLYARAGIPEYWIVNLRRQSVEVYTSPDTGEGRYGTVHTYARGQRVQSSVLPRLSIEIETLL
ncbi:Uma2 family endonuclease [Archangium sp.]|jgi:Uma2 family endonuclease|uniref:Uma2 family endonuclease n=1 Tax=Archangium sp. TaxID=1872627 RepID=UPI002EDB08F8